MRNIILLGLTSLLTDISSEMVYPLLPFFLVSSLGASPAILGLIEGVAESLASLLKVVSGYISDRAGRRKPLTILGYAGSALGKLLLYLAGSWVVVFAARIVDRFGKGIRTAPRDALIAESSSSGRRGRAFGLHRAMDSAGAAIGVLLAFMLISAAPSDFRRVFLWSLIPAVLGVILLFFVRETRLQDHRTATIQRFRWRVLPAKLRAFLIISLLFSLGNSSNAFLLLRARALHVDPAQILLLYLMYNISYALFSYPAGRVSDVLGRKMVLVAGYILFAVVYFGFAFFVDPERSWITWALFILYGIFSAFTDGVEKALVSDLAPVEMRGTAIGLHATLVGIGLLPASLIAGQLWTQIGPEAALGLGGLTGFVAAIALALLL
jgi:MFS family permease